MCLKASQHIREVGAEMSLLLFKNPQIPGATKLQAEWNNACGHYERLLGARKQKKERKQAAKKLAKARLNGG
jgi:hypothetical protein